MALSVAEAVGDAVQAALVTLALTSGAPPVAVPIARRKLPSLPEGKDPPELVISIGEERWERLTAVEKVKKYPAAVTIVTGEGNKAADDMTIRSWLKQIEAVLEAQATFIGVTGFDGVDIVNEPPFDPQALAKDFNYSTVTGEVTVVEEHADG